MIQTQISALRAILIRRPWVSDEETCPRCVQWKNSHPHKAPECHRKAARAGPVPGKKSSPHLLNRTIFYNPVHALSIVPRTTPNQHLWTEWAGNVMNYLHMEPENTASQSTQTQACYATIFSKNQALWLGTRFWTSFNWMDNSSRRATNGCLMYSTSVKLAWVGYSSILELQERSSTQSSLFARYQGSDCQLSAQTQWK